MSLQFQDALSIDLSDNAAYLAFANPGRSTQDMMLQLVIQDQVILTSGRLEPGYEVSSLELDDGAAALLKEGVYDGKFVINYYDPENHERAMVNTEAPVTVTVRH